LSLVARRMSIPCGHSPRPGPPSECEAHGTTYGSTCDLRRATSTPPSVSFDFVNGRRPVAGGSGPAGIVDGGIYRLAGSSTPAPWVGPAAGDGARPILRYSTRLRRSGEVLHVHRSGCTADLRHPVERLCTIPLNAPMNSCPLYSLISAEQSSAYLGRNNLSTYHATERASLNVGRNSSPRQPPGLRQRDLQGPRQCGLFSRRGRRLPSTRNCLPAEPAFCHNVGNSETGCPGRHAFD
jgi:hypothetical protein